MRIRIRSCTYEDGGRIDEFKEKGQVNMKLIYHPMREWSTINNVTPSAKSSLILGENKADFCR